jgi:nucleoside-diphosphate-sugar epimerase
MRLFVTGGTGFIGSHVIQRALAAGHEVLALRRSPDSQLRIMLAAEPHWLTKSMAAVGVDDLVGVDALVHLAAVGVSPQRATWQELFQTNVLESLQAWQTASDAGVQRFVICGSCYEYGRAAERCEFLTETAPLEPIGGYAASKAAASMAAIALAAERRLEMTIARPFHVYGEGQHPHNFWPSLRRAALTGEDFDMTPGEQWRDFVPVEHVVDALLACCTSEDASPGRAQIVNIGTGRAQRLREFAQSWWQRWGAKGSLRIGALPYRDGEVMRYVPQPGRAAA